MKKYKHRYGSDTVPLTHGAVFFIRISEMYAILHMSIMT